jgi:FkbM family methyltransferase
MKKTLWFIKQSLLLDYKFFRVSRWSFSKKVKFLILKYFLICKHSIKKFTLGKDFCYFDNKKIYYDSRFGVAGYQRILSTHQYLIELAKIHDVITVVDIGANVGFFSKLCRDIFPESKIFSFEPVPKIFQCLENNFKGDASTKVFNLGISDFNGEAKMNFNEQDSAISQITDEGNIKIHVRKLDNIVKENNIKSIDILKLDTETFEAHVLRGGSNSLNKTKYLFMEITMEEDNHNYTISSLLKLLSTESYDFQLVAFRNYSDVGEGYMLIMDALFVNRK